ncbi:MAG: PrsW family intramembrane metalloprotease, partial [Methanobacteriota archaeon]
MSRDLLPLSIVLLVLLVLVSGFAAQRGMHLQDGMYQLGIDNPAYLNVVGTDPRYVTYDTSLPRDISPQAAGVDVKIQGGTLFRTSGDKGRAAQKSLERDYQAYRDRIYQQQDDIFAAYPLWIQNDYVTSELDFLATQSGQQLVVQGKAVPDAPEP